MDSMTPEATAGGGAPLEVEIKLSATPAILAAMRKHAAVRSLLDGGVRTQTLVSRYYDTAECDLRDAGVALRIRRIGRRWLQTAKGAGDAAGGLHRRLEFEWPLAAPRVNRERLAFTPWKKALAHSDARLVTVFTTSVSRSTQPLRFPDGTRALLCLDRGTIVAGGRREPLCEIELELVDGDVRQLFALAQSIATELPVTVAQTSKAERGYALRMGLPPAPARAQRVPLPADSSAAAALAAVGADCLRQIGANVEALHADGSGEFVHQLRVGVRRLRSLINLVDPAIAPSSLETLDAELQWIAGVAGAVRDCDVFSTQTLQPIAPNLIQAAHRRDLGTLRGRVTRLRGARHLALHAAIASARTTKLLLDCAVALVDIAAHPGPIQAPSSARGLAQTTLDKRHLRLRKRGKHLRSLPAAERHRARIAAKKLRYAAEFFAPLFHRGRASRYIDALSQLQDALGRLNDAATAEGLLETVAGASAPSPALVHAAGMVRGWNAAQSARELVRLDKAWREFARHKPFWQD